MGELLYIEAIWFLVAVLGEIYSNRIAVTGTFDLNLRDLDEG